MIIHIMWEWFLNIVLLATLFGYIRFKWNRRHFEALASKLPGPATIPIFGNLFCFKDVTCKDSIFKVAEIVKEFYKYRVARLWFGPFLVVGVSRAEDLETVLCNPKIVDKSILFSMFHLRSKGSFTMSGEEWRKCRRVANKMFQTNHLKGNYLKVFHEQSIIMTEYLKKKSKSGTFDISLAFMRCALDTICRTGLGINIHSQEDESLAFPVDIARSSELIIERAYKPWLIPSFIFKMTEFGKETLRRINGIHEFTISLITKRRNILEEFNERNKKITAGETDLNKEVKVNPAPYIDSLLETAEAEGKDDLDLAKEILDVIIGGMDTSAIANSYCLVMLGIYKEWQTKVQKEIDELFGNEEERELTMEDLNHLETLEMVIKEVLRISTSPQSTRLLKEDLRLTQYTLPAGTIVYVSPYSVHRDSMYWSHPDKFYPEHFLPENVSSRPKHSYLPFSAGPRGCPGSRYAMVSMKILLAHILSNFNVECDLKFEEIKYSPNLMLEIEGGYPIRLIPRQIST